MNARTVRIDAHQHFWQIARGDYGWLTPDLKPLYRDFLPADLQPLLNEHSIDGTVLIQAAPSVAETTFMLELAERAPFIKGVVGWVDMDAPDAPSRIKDMSKREKLVGLRPMIQDIQQDNWMLRDNIANALIAMRDTELTFDALILPRHLPHLRTLVSRHPDLKVIIDHGSKPDIKDQLISRWAEDMAAIARDSNAWCKLSGLVTEASANWSAEDLKPYVDHLLETFGPDRLIWGSDWPVCTLASEYGRWVETTEILLANLSGEDLDKIWRRNAIEAYGLAT
ncbi:amidohydrolase family protein [Roseibium sp.]|uniref:amidohydrolase family protein n=1 Tax=Roseibium sp. TaxID=1936156 RepID=UPI003A983397